MVTRSPSFHRRTGAGKLPFMVVAVLLAPVKLTVCSPIERRMLFSGFDGTAETQGDTSGESPSPVTNCLLEIIG